jgi:hypothetical protein
MVIVPPATTDTTSKVDSASSPLSTMHILPIRDALNGIGPPKLVLLAQVDGFSMLITSALLFPINASHTTTPELAHHASRVMTLSADLVSFPPPTMHIQAILAVVYGLGILKCVFNVQTTGFSTPIRHACPSLTNAALMIIPVPASLVSRDMISSTELVSSLPQTMLSQAIPDVLFGIGISKCAKLALTTGSLTPKKSVFQFLINANQVMQVAIVPLAI